jgi:hypothetical protein
MSALTWPPEYVEALNNAVNRALTEPIGRSIDAITQIHDEFKSHPAFIGHGDDLEKSILRNKILAATLSVDENVRLVLETVLQDLINSTLFDAEELSFLSKVAAGKIGGLGA